MANPYIEETTGTHMFKTVTFLLFSQLAVGGLISIALVPDPAGKRFFRFCGVCCAILLAAALSVSSVPFEVAVWLGICLIATGPFIFLIQQDQFSIARKALVVAAGAGCVGLAANALLVSSPEMPMWVSAASVVYQISGAAFIGSVIFGMTLGHWYLIVPTLPIGPLRKLTLLMIVTTGLRTVLLIVVLVLGASSQIPEIAATIDSFSRLAGLFFWARTLFGILGPIVICYMTWETVKLNATQSATGLLYVATILVLIGETMSLYLYHSTHLPV